jgi:fanconi anemia group I protein
MGNFLLQANVKEVLYEGLKQIVTSDPAVADSVLDFLWPHFLKYYTEVKLPDRLSCPFLFLSFSKDMAKLC